MTIDLNPARPLTALLLAAALSGLVACSSNKSPADTAAGADTGAGPSGDGGDGGGDGDGDDAGDTGAPAEQSVAGLIVRRVNPGQDIEAFKSARDAYVAALMAQPGAEVDREFEAVVDFSIGAAPVDPVFIGFTQFDGPSHFQSGAGALTGGAEEAAFFSTFTPELFALVSPLEGGPASIAAIASGEGQVLEVAPRDLSAYADFDADAYAAARDAFLAVLGDRDGVVGEHQWVSIADPNVVVGMTAYESFDAWAAIWSDPAFYAAPEYGAFLGAYPPAGGYLTTSVK